MAPREQVVFVPRGAVRERTVTVDLSDPPPSLLPVDVLLVFDYSSSMEHQIDPVRRSAISIVSRFRRNFPDSRFAVAAFSDYVPLFSQNGEDQPWILITDFTSRPDTVAEGIGRIRLGHGGDGPEAYSRAIFEAASARWRPNAQKIVVLFGDSVSHPIDPGRDGLLGTSDDLTFEQAVSALSAAKVQAIGIYEPKSPEVARQFNYLAQRTGGLAIPLDEAGNAAHAFVIGLAQQLRMIPTLRASQEFAEWLADISPARERSQVRFDFATTMHVPDNADAGKHLIYVTAHHGDHASTQIGRAAIIIVTGWMNGPAFQLPLFGALAILPLVALVRRSTRDLGLWYFNRSGLLLRAMIRTGATLAAVSYLACLLWLYLQLQEPYSPALSDLVRFSAQTLAIGV